VPFNQCRICSLIEDVHRKTADVGGQPWSSALVPREQGCAQFDNSNYVNNCLKQQLFWSVIDENQSFAPCTVLNLLVLAKAPHDRQRVEKKYVCAGCVNIPLVMVDIAFIWPQLAHQEEKSHRNGRITY